MAEDVLEWYGTFNTIGCPDELLFGDFHDQPIPPVYCDSLSDDNNNDNNIPFTPVDDIFLYSSEL